MNGLIFLTYLFYSAKSARVLGTYKLCKDFLFFLICLSESDLNIYEVSRFRFLVLVQVLLIGLVLNPPRQPQHVYTFLSMALDAFEILNGTNGHAISNVVESKAVAREIKEYRLADLDARRFL